MQRPEPVCLRYKRLAMCLIVAAIMFVMAAMAMTPVRGQEEPPGIETGPIDPAAGAWITYRGERVAPEAPEPQVFSQRIEYDLPPEPSQYGKLIEATEKELDASGRTASSRTYTVQAVDRLYRDQDGNEEGYWPYWLTPGLSEGDATIVEAGTRLTAEEVETLDFKGLTLSVLRMRGEGIELLAEQRTGLVLGISREGGEKLEIEDTNMLANHAAWDYTPDELELGSRLKGLAEEYPHLVEVSSLGKSALGRDIWLAHVTDYTSSDKKSAVVITGAIEGNAPEGYAFLLDFLETLVEEALNDETAAEVLRGLNIYAVPLVNPDGLQRWLAMPSSEESPLLASQAPRNGNLVHINRNFDVKWEEGDRNPASAYYAGPAPFSETESQALKAIFEDVPAELYLNLHTGSDLICAPWNWSENPDSNPEKDLYEDILSDISQTFTYPVSVGAPQDTFTGSSTDWAYEGNGASSPICFDLYFHQLEAGEEEGEERGEDGSSLASYASHREAIDILMENIMSYLAVDIVVPDLRVEVNVPIDAVVEIVVTGKRALPDAKARLILPEGSGLKFSTIADKEIALGDLQPGSSTKVMWNLEGRAGGSGTATFTLTSSYPDYRKIPGTYTAEMEVSISTQRTWLVLMLLSILVLLILGGILLSMRKHHRTSSEQAKE